MSAPEKEPRDALLCLDSYAGRSETPVRVIGETRCRYRIRAVGWTRLAGGCRLLEPGGVTLVPRYAIKFTRGATP